MTAAVVLSDEVGELALATRLFASKELDARRIDREGCLSPQLLERLAGLGLFGVTLPTEYGGLGESLHTATQVIQVLAEYDRSVATTVGLHLGLGTRALVRYGSAALKQRELPALARGETLAAFATTEPQAGSDLSKLGTRLTTRPGGGFGLTGEKAYVTNGGWAGLVTVTARSDGGERLSPGLTLAVVRSSAPGFSRGPEERKLGLKGSSTRGLHFDEVVLEANDVLTGPPSGAAQLEHTLSWGRTLLSAGCTGTARAALGRARLHTALRRQFGRSLDQQPVVRLQLARATALVEAMNALVDVTATAPEDDALHRWSLSAKVFCSERACEIVDLAVQLHGAGGVLEDTGLPLFLRDVRVTRIFEGANDVLLTLAGTLELQTPSPVAESGPVARALARLVRRHVDRLRRTLGVRAFVHPQLLHELGTAVVWRDALIASDRRGVGGAAMRLLEREARLACRAAARAHTATDDIDALLEATP